MTQKNDTAGNSDYLKAWPQYLMPGHLLSRLMFALTRWRLPAFKNRLIDWFMSRYNIDLSEAQEQDPHAFESFNSFFTRALQPGARTVVEEQSVLACPVDGCVSQLGTIEEERIFQAKGHDYSLQTLVGGRESWAIPYRGGSFATLYLSPRDYHRIHMPVDGTLREMVHIPGRLFSVNPATTRTVPSLFARNERVVCHFDTEVGPMAMVLVGAVFVSAIETVWGGLITPPAGRVVRQWRYEGDEAPQLKRGEEMGRFNMGSTVILLFGPDAVAWEETLNAGTPTRMGERIARTQTRS